MTVRTTAMECVVNARTDVQSAIDNLGRVVIEQCEGTGDYTKEYNTKMEKALNKLIKVRNMLE